MKSIPPRVIQVVDRVLLEHGELDPFECLLELGMVTRSDYSDWLNAKRTDLQSVLLVPLTEAIVALEQVQTYARAQGLNEAARSAITPDAISGDLTIKSSQRFAELCGCVLRRPTENSQTDLFHDSASAVALYELQAALAEYRLESASKALEHLARVSPGLPALKDFQFLLKVCALSPAPPAEQLRQLDIEIVPLAVRLLGRQAHDYLTPLWIKLAEALSGTSFSSYTPKLHASYAYVRAHHWDKVIHSVEAEPDWDCHAALIARLAEAHARQGQQDKARLLWSRLCWEHAETATDILVLAPGDPVLARLWSEFLNAEAEFAVGDFPAWLLLADPRQARLVPPESAPDTPQGYAYAALHRVITSDGDLDARRALQALRRDLLKLYLNRKQPV